MGTRRGILIEAPEGCYNCPCLRNTIYGLKCFLTEEDLTYHNIYIDNEVGQECPVKEYDESLFDEN